MKKLRIFVRYFSIAKEIICIAFYDEIIKRKAIELLRLQPVFAVFFATERIVELLDSQASLLN